MNPVKLSAYALIRYGICKDQELVLVLEKVRAGVPIRARGIGRACRLQQHVSEILLARNL